MTVNLLTEHYFEFLSFKGGCTGSSESTHVKMQHCWKSYVMAQFSNNVLWSLLFQMHMAHFKEDYHNETEAKKHSDGLAVLAFFFEVRNALRGYICQLKRFYPTLFQVK